MNRRALLLILIVVVALILVLYLVVGRGGTHGASAPTPTPATKKGTPVKPVQISLVHEEKYAAHLLTAVDLTVGTFNNLVRRAHNARNMGKLNNICSYAIQRAEVMQGRADGVPHPYPWYSPSGQLHHKLLGIYHQMVGAATACQTDAGNSDSANASIAVQDMASAAREMKAMDVKLHRLARRLAAA